MFLHFYASIATCTITGLIFLLALYTTIEHMKNTLIHTTVATTLALASTIALSNAAVVWTGADNFDFFNDANWDFSASTLTAIDPAVAINDDISITSVANTVTAGGGNLIIGDAFTFTLTSTDLNITDGFGLSGVSDAAQSSVNMIDSSITAQFATNGLDISLDGTSSIKFNGGGDPINSQSSLTNLVFNTGAKLILPTRAEFDEQVTANGGAGTITVNGTAATAENMDTLFSFTGAGPTTGTALAPIPEPSSTALLGLAGLALILRRRK